MSNVYGVAFSQSNPSSYPSLAPTFITFKKISDGSDVTPPTLSQVATTGIYAFTFTPSFSVYFLLDGITVSQASDRYVFGVLDPVQKTDIQIAELGSTLAAINSTLVAIGTTGVALGTTGVALGTTGVALGTTGVALGTTAVAAVTQLGSTLTALNSTLVALGTTGNAFGQTNVAIGTTITGLVSASASLNTGIDAKLGSTLSSFGTTSVDPGDIFGFLKRAQEFREGQQTFTKQTGAWAISTRGGTLLSSKSLSNTSTSVSRT